MSRLLNCIQRATNPNHRECKDVFGESPPRSLRFLRLDRDAHGNGDPNSCLWSDGATIHESAARRKARTRGVGLQLP